VFFREILSRLELMYKMASWHSSLTSKLLPPSFMITDTENCEPPAPRICSRCCRAETSSYTGPNSPIALPEKSGSSGVASTRMIQPRSLAESWYTLLLISWICSDRAPLFRYHVHLMGTLNPGLFGSSASAFKIDA